jgi:hypothetical protein
VEGSSPEASSEVGGMDVGVPVRALRLDVALRLAEPTSLLIVLRAAHPREIPFDFFVAEALSGGSDVLVIGGGRSVFSPGVIHGMAPVEVLVPSWGSIEWDEGNGVPLQLLVDVASVVVDVMGESTIRSRREWSDGRGTSSHHMPGSGGGGGNRSEDRRKITAAVGGDGEGGHLPKEVLSGASSAACELPDMGNDGFKGGGRGD